MSHDVVELLERVERLEQEGRRARQRDGVALAGAAVAGLATLLLAGGLALRTGPEAPVPTARARMTTTTLPAVWRR